MAGVYGSEPSSIVGVCWLVTACH